MLWKKNTYLLFLNFPHILLQCSAMVLFKSLKIPKIMRWMDRLATWKYDVIWTQPTYVMLMIFIFGDIHDNMLIRNKVKGMGIS